MKRTSIIILALVAAGLAGAGGYGLYRVGMHRGMTMAASADAPAMPATNAQGASLVDPATGKKVLYWHDPMVPGQKFDKSGKSPFMDMELEPVFADEASDEGKVSISPRVQQNLGIRTAEVTKGSLASSVEVIGNIVYNERDVALVQARSNGFIERLYVRAALDPVKKGQALAQLYVPEWIAAQEEYLSVKRMGAGTENLLDAARQRMRLVGMTDEHIRSVAASGKVQARMTIVSPVNGVVTELGAREGMTVMAGAPLFRINGLATVWVNAEIPESMAAAVRPGNTVEARTPAFPGQTFSGKVSALVPEVNAATRTLKARIELSNPQGRLVPGMFANLMLHPAARKNVLLVPTEAVIQTGQRNVVMVAQGDGKFMPVNVDIGNEINGQTEIRTGLEAGQKVVVSGQFLIDSEASLKGTATRMSELPAPAPASPNSQAPTAVHRAEGKIEQIAPDGITISHGPVPSLQWGAMTMGFKPPAGGMPKHVAVGDSVAFQFRPVGDGEFEIIGISTIATRNNSDKAGMAK